MPALSLSLSHSLSPAAAAAVIAQSVCRNDCARDQISQAYAGTRVNERVRVARELLQQRRRRQKGFRRCEWKQWETLIARRERERKRGREREAAGAAVVLLKLNARNERQVLNKRKGVRQNDRQTSSCLAFAYSRLSLFLPLKKNTFPSTNFPPSSLSLRVSCVSLSLRESCVCDLLLPLRISDDERRTTSRVESSCV